MSIPKQQVEVIDSKLKFLFGATPNHKNGLSGSVLEISVNVNREIKSKEIQALTELPLTYSVKRSGEGVRLLFTAEA